MVVDGEDGPQRLLLLLLLELRPVVAVVAVVLLVARPGLGRRGGVAGAVAAAPDQRLRLGHGRLAPRRVRALDDGDGRRPLDDLELHVVAPDGPQRRQRGAAGHGRTTAAATAAAVGAGVGPLLPLLSFLDRPLPLRAAGAAMPCRPLWRDGGWGWGVDSGRGLPLA